MNGSAFAALQRLVPQHALSRAIGKLAAAEQTWVRKPFIHAFARAYDVSLEDAARGSLNDYASFNDFFTRELREEARPLAGDEQVAVCPADGSVSQAGTIERGQLLQAKGHSYALEALLGESGTTFDGGSFATIYLAPRDYHRVHLPIAGTLVRCLAIPGELYSVNALTEAHIDGLFARNERLVCHFQTAAGPMTLVLVGAMIVAGIDTAWGGPISPYQRLEAFSYESLPFSRGAEIGRFFLGSTVIVCLPRGVAQLASGIRHGARVKMGQALFHLNSAAGKSVQD